MLVEGLTTPRSKRDCLVVVVVVVVVMVAVAAAGAAAAAAAVVVVAAAVIVVDFGFYSVLIMAGGWRHCLKDAFFFSTPYFAVFLHLTLSFHIQYIYLALSRPYNYYLTCLIDVFK